MDIQEESNNNLNLDKEYSNLSQIPLNESTIYYYNASKDNYKSKHFNKALMNILIYIKLVPNNPKAYILKGKIYMNLNKYENGLNSFLRGIKLGEKSIEILYGVARAYKELYQFDDALKYYNKALEMEPTAKSHYLLANCLYSMGKKEHAIEVYDKALKLNPNYIDVYFHKGVCLSNLNMKEEAINMYNKTIQLNPNYVDAYFQRGYCYYNLTKYQKAMQEMNKVLELDPNYYQAYYEKGFCFQKMKRYEEAIIELSKAIKQNIYFEQAYFQRGYCCELIRDFSSAIKDYQRVILLNKNSYMGFYRLGICLLQKKSLSEALDMFNKAIALNRANYDAYYYKGMCQRYLKYYEDAIITFNYFLNCFAKSKSSTAREISEEQIGNVYYNKGRCLLSLGRYTEAIPMFTNYLRKNRNGYEVYFKRAVCYYNTHMYKKAIYDLTVLIQELKKNEEENNKKGEEEKKLSKLYKNKSRKYINKNYEDEDDYEYNNKKNIGHDDEEIRAEIYFLRSKAYININKIDSGLKDMNTFFELIEIEKKKIEKEYENEKDNKNKNDSEIDRLINKKYDISEAHFKKGYCHLVLFDYNSAMKEFENTIKLDPTNITAYFNMGICLYNLNNKKDAIKYYQKVLDAYPNDIEAFINIVKCYREIDNPETSYDLLLKKTPVYLKEEKKYLTKIPKLYYETGMSLFTVERIEEAMVYFNQCIDFEINKNNKKDTEFLSECYYRKGYCLSKLNNKNDAIKEFKEALKYNNKNADIINYNGHCLMVLGKYNEAIECYIKSMNINNKKFAMRIDGNFSIGYCYAKLKKFEDALKYFELSRKINENIFQKINVNEIEGESGEKGKEDENNVKSNDKYRDLTKRIIDLNFYSGICNMELGKYDEAINDFDTCIKYDEKFSDSYYKKGIIYSKQNKSKEAIEQFEKAISYNNKILEFKDALKKEKEKNKNTKKNTTNDNNNDINYEENHKNMEGIHKTENDDYLKMDSRDIKNDINLEDDKYNEEKEDSNDDLDIKRSKTTKIDKNGIFKNKLIAKSRNLYDKIEEKKDHNSNEENSDNKLLLNKDSVKFNENIKKINDDFGHIRYESKAFVIKEK